MRRVCAAPPARRSIPAIVLPVARVCALLRGTPVLVDGACDELRAKGVGGSRDEVPAALAPGTGACAAAAGATSDKYSIASVRLLFVASSITAAASSGKPMLISCARAKSSTRWCVIAILPTTSAYHGWKRRRAPDEFLSSLVVGARVVGRRLRMERACVTELRVSTVITRILLVSRYGNLKIFFACGGPGSFSAPHLGRICPTRCGVAPPQRSQEAKLDPDGFTADSNGVLHISVYF